MCGKSVVPHSRKYEELAQKYGARSLIQREHTHVTIWPSQKAHVFFEWQGKPAITPMTWGFSEQHWLYNARAESIDKYAWRAPFETNRCVIPLESFHEGKKDFFGKDLPLYVAGMYGVLSGNGTRAKERFVFTMLTTPANPIVFPYHHRMPVLLGEQHLLDWCNPKAPGRDMLEQSQEFTERFVLEVAA